MSVVYPQRDIHHLSTFAWMNPPNIPLIHVKVTDLVLALVIQLLGFILQNVWDMLNFDCTTTQVESVIDKARMILSIFKTITNAFDPNHVAMNIKEKFEKDLENPLQEAMDALASKKEAWASFGASLKGSFDGIDDMKTIKDQTVKSIEEGLKAGKGISAIPTGSIEAMKSAQQSYSAFTAMMDNKGKRRDVSMMTGGMENVEQEKGIDDSSIQAKKKGKLGEGYG